MMLNASINGIRVTNLPSQKFNGRKKRTMNYSGSFLIREPSNGRRSLRLLTLFSVSRGTASNVVKDGTTF
jgi:hypothetical protein